MLIMKWYGTEIERVRYKKLKRYGTKFRYIASPVYCDVPSLKNRRLFFSVGADLTMPQVWIVVRDEWGLFAEL